MKCIIPEISWNNRDPVFSLDIQPKIDEYLRLATSGSDTHIVIWYLNIESSGSISVEVAADLNKHQKAVNVVRWSPSGQYLASGDDESIIILWIKRTDLDPPPLEPDSEEFKESWTIHKILRGHMDDIYDISWSSDSNELISGSVDNTAILWNIQKSTKTAILSNHKGFVQGVAWDPLNQYYATLSSDRVCRVFSANTKKIISSSSKSSLPFPESSPLYGQTVRLYHDDTLKSYFRRLSFSPDGNLLISPAGCIETEHCNKKIYLTYIYTRYSFKQPTLALPSPDQFTVAARCCPVLFEHRKDGPKPVIPLPYRMIIAIASQSTVIFYDTQQIQPFAAVTNIHYTRITDISWSSDGLIVAVSSTDGFCSLISFKRGELGEIYVPKEDVTKTPEKLAKTQINEQCINTDIQNKYPVIVEDETASDAWVKPESPLKMECDGEMENTQDIKLVLEDTMESSENEPSPMKQSENKQLLNQSKISKTITEKEQQIMDPNNTTMIEKIHERSELTSELKFTEQVNTKNTTKSTQDNIENNAQVANENANQMEKKSETKIEKSNEKNIAEKNELILSTDNIEKTPTPKTPRRVNFITLSSPKSKKKIL